MSIAYTRSLASLALVLATFSGQLLDRTTGQPLVHVQVHLSGPSTGDATSNAHGRFTLSQLKPGSYTIDVESNDVPQQSFHTTLAAGRTTTLTIKACSTTLDYHCDAPSDGGGPGL